MIVARQNFLTALFADLVANGVRYCILRNYDDLYGNADTDLDLIVSPYSLARFERCLHAMAEQTGWHFVHAARYVNFSHVFWHPKSGFLRIDYETDVRWRFFTVLSARQVLDSSRRHGEFFIPSPELESVILYVAVIWRGMMSDRYRRQLGVLYAACGDPAALRRELVAAFGPAGHELADFQAHTDSAPFDATFSWRVRRSLMMTSHLGRSRLGALMASTASDGVRLFERVRRSAGVSLLFVSSHAVRRQFEDLSGRINFLFPTKKNWIHESDLRDRLAAQARWNLGLRLRRLRTLFKGGLFVRSYHVADNTALNAVVRTHSRHLYPSRTFISTEDRDGRVCFGHVESGFMASSPKDTALNDQSFSEFFIRFISAILERHMQRKQSAPKRGVFCVLVGLDGSGKTTLARNLCELAMRDRRIAAVRYFHWRPRTFHHVEFPLPEFKNQPRKPPQPAGLWNTVLSALRLAKNAALVNLAWWIHVRRMLRQGRLVLVDRYLYNYYLDPDSVKFSGPPGLLALAKKLFPRPDLVLTLSAPAEVLLARKQELSAAEIQRQAAVLDTLPFDARRVARVDATLPPEELAAAAFREIGKSFAER